MADPNSPTPGHPDADDDAPAQPPTGGAERARRGARNYMKYTGMAFQMIGIMLVFVFAGIFLDGRFDTSPWLTIVFSLLGVAGGLYGALKDFI